MAIAQQKTSSPVKPVAQKTTANAHAGDSANLADLAALARAAPAARQLMSIVQMSQSATTIQRVISDAAWSQLEQGTSKTVYATVELTNPAPPNAKSKKKIRYIAATDARAARLQVMDGDTWKNLPGGSIATLKAHGEWDGSFVNVAQHDYMTTDDTELSKDHINNDKTKPATNITGAETGTLEMDVQSNKDNDRLNFVHRSLSLYERGGKNKQGREHLTLENEHVLAMLAQQRDKSSSGYDRTYDWGPETRKATDKVYTKPDVNKSLLEGFGTREIDNLNFYLTKDHGGAEADMETAKPAGATLPKYDAGKHASPERPAEDDRLSLHAYMTFVARALKSTRDKSAAEIVPAAYGVKYEKLLENMEAQMGIDPRNAFLDSSDVGHRKKFIQAVIVMQAKGLVKNLEGAASWQQQYAKYHLNPPILRKKGEQDSWTDVLSGAPGYNELDAEYAGTFYNPIRDAVLAYTGT